MQPYPRFISRPRNTLDYNQLKGQECYICLDRLPTSIPLTAKDIISVFHMGETLHAVHKECMKKLLTHHINESKKIKCGVCRQDVDEITSFDDWNENMGRLLRELVSKPQDFKGKIFYGFLDPYNMNINSTNMHSETFIQLLCKYNVRPGLMEAIIRVYSADININQ